MLLVSTHQELALGVGGALKCGGDGGDGLCVCLSVCMCVHMLTLECDLRTSVSYSALRSLDWATFYNSLYLACTLPCETVADSGNGLETILLTVS